MTAVVVNGEPCELAEGGTVTDVVHLLACPVAGIAVARNGEVVPRSSWAATVLDEGDLVEVLTAAQGG